MVWVGLEEALVGFIALRDQPNPSAQPLFQRLEADHIQTVMFSGDSETTSAIIAKEIGLQAYQGDCSRATDLRDAEGNLHLISNGDIRAVSNLTTSGPRWLLQ